MTRTFREKTTQEFLQSVPGNQAQLKIDLLKNLQELRVQGYHVCEEVSKPVNLEYLVLRKQYSYH